MATGPGHFKTGDFLGIIQVCKIHEVQKPSGNIRTFHIKAVRENLIPQYGIELTG